MNLFSHPCKRSLELNVNSLRIHRTVRIKIRMIADLKKEVGIIGAHAPVGLRASASLIASAAVLALSFFVSFNERGHLPSVSSSIAMLS
jgi:hypothetical protein